MKLGANLPCPCGSGQKYKKCCKVFHNGALAKNALELMKSRYSAFVAHDYKYIIKTTHPQNPDFTTNIQEWKDSILEFSTNSDFNSLSIVDFIEADNEAFVTFKVEITQHGQAVGFTEKSLFYKENGAWLYHSGEFL